MKEMKKFISIIWGYHKQIFSFEKEQNYHMMPLEAMKEQGYECEVFAIDSQVKIEEDPNFIPGVKVIYYKSFFQYLKYLWENKDAIIYSNSLTIKTLLVGIIGKNTVFIPHDSIFGSNFMKKVIIKFFYFFFGKIRLNNDAEVEAVNRIKKNLGIKIPLVISDFFYNSENKFNNEENIFISLGNLIPKKQPEFLLKALQIVKAKGYKFKLKVIGEDRLLQYYGYTYSSLLQKYELQEEVEVVGYKPHREIPNILNGACLYINTSKQEGLCLAVYESALAGLQTVLPNILSFDNIFGENGLYYQKNSVEDLAVKIIFFLDNKEKFTIKIKKVQNYILQNYKYNIVKNALKELFKNFE